MRLKIATRRSFIRLAILAVALIAFGVAVHTYLIRMPGTSFAGPLPPITEAQRDLASELSGYVEHLAGPEIGERNLLHPQKLDDAAAWITSTLAQFGYVVRRQEFDLNGQTCVNLDIELPGTTYPDEIIVIGAHYDSVVDCPGANDNGSGVAATLALARRFADTSPQRTLRFALFTNEEPPYFWTESMGSLVYARACKTRGDNIVAMFSLETIGFYSDAPGSQEYPEIFNWFYPTTGNFIAFVGNLSSVSLVRSTVGSFRELTPFPSEGGAMPGQMTGIGWSDQWSFWQQGYSALMITDTAPFRYPHYHRATDTPNKLDYERMARVVEGVGLVVDRMANPDAAGRK